MRLLFISTLIGAVGVFFTGCAHVQQTSPPVVVAENAVAQENKPLIGETPQVFKASDTKALEKNIVVRGIKLKVKDFDFPITINSKVEQWIDYFCYGSGRVYFSRYLERSEFFIPYILPLLKQNGMPEDLVYLAMIESGFNNFARSRAKAVGPWQFISATGKRYGLMVNWWVDERRDIHKSTLAAVEYLRDLYSIFQRWELAAAAYNAGEAKVARAVRRFGTKDFWTISKHRFLRPETRDYVPKIIAAAIIAKNRELFGFPNVAHKPGVDEAVAGDGEVVKLVRTDKPEEKLKEELADIEGIDELEKSDDIREEPGNAGAKPAVTLTAAYVAEQETPETKAQGTAATKQAKPVPTPHVTKTGEVGGEELVEFELQSPADLLKIARAAGLSYLTVKSLNPELIRWCTPPMMGAYKIKLPASTRERFMETYNHEAFPREVRFMTYKVRRGDTLQRIAGRFGIKVDPIVDLNGVSSRMPLRNGINVVLPMPSDRSRSVASLEIRDPPERRRYRRGRNKGTRSHLKISYEEREAVRAKQRPGT
ncbi:MAG: transglycosylase SLT domain-containing protein [Bdellovibrionota bacterium]